MSSYTKANTINDLFRDLFALLDEVAYNLLGGMYEILFNVAGADLFTNATIKNFYTRVQLIIGVFMVFKLAISIIQGIVNPDTFMDKKAGASTIISRIIFALILLTVLSPLNIPTPNTNYEKNIADNGLLFGTLYELQDRILNNNTLGRLILGTTNSSSSGSQNNSQNQNQQLVKASKNFAITILKGFIHINVKDESKSETIESNRVCNFSSTNQLKAGYKVYQDASQAKTDHKQLLSIINLDCANPNGSGKRYAFVYVPIISTVVAGIFIYILLGEIITIAIRTLKLAVLRLLAPIPIISYVDPKQAKDGAFGSWVKSLTSTYLELFMHLAVIYFVIFLIQDIIDNGINAQFGQGFIGFITAIFVFVGLFFFIRQAPKFIKDILGIKGSSSNVGLAGLLGGTAMLAGGGGLRGFAYGAMQGTETAVQGQNQGKAVPLGAVWKQNSDQMAKWRTGDRDAQGGIMGQTMDYLGYKTRERRAGQLGIGRNALAAAKYEQETWEDRASTLQKEMDFAKLEYERTGTDAAKQKYDKLYDAYQIASAKASKAGKVVKTMEEQRSALQTTPRVVDIREETYRSAHKVRTTDKNTTHTYKYGPDPGDTVQVQYRGVALDQNGNQILDGATPPDTSINPDHRNRNFAGPQYQFDGDIKEGYTGLTDDVYPWAGGGHGGPPSGP